MAAMASGTRGPWACFSYMWWTERENRKWESFQAFRGLAISGLKWFRFILIKLWSAIWKASIYAVPVVEMTMQIHSCFSTFAFLVWRCPNISPYEWTSMWAQTQEITEGDKLRFMVELVQSGSTERRWPGETARLTTRCFSFFYIFKFLFYFIDTGTTIHTQHNDITDHSTSSQWEGNRESKLLNIIQW